MSKASKFEELVEKFFLKASNGENFKVERNVKIRGPDGERQVDVLLESKVGPLDLRTVVECKDYKGKVNVQKVDELHSKMQDINANKGVIVAGNGFTGGAIKKAHRLGIELCTLSEALSPNWMPEVDLPILIEENLPTFGFELNVRIPKATTFAHPLLVNGRDIWRDFNSWWKQSNKEIRAYGSEELLGVLNITEPFFIRDALGNDYLAQKLDLKFNFEASFYLGNLSSLPSTMILEKIHNGDRTIIVEAEHLLKYREYFAKYKALGDVPSIHVAVFTCLSIPEIDHSSVEAFWVRIGD